MPPAVLLWGGSVLAVLLLAGGLYACGKQDGRDAARVESLDRTVKAVETRRDAEDAAAREPDPAERVHERWGRD